MTHARHRDSATFDGSRLKPVNFVFPTERDLQPKPHVALAARSAAAATAAAAASVLLFSLPAWMICIRIMPPCQQEVRYVFFVYRVYLLDLLKCGQNDFLELF